MTVPLHAAPRGAGKTTSAAAWLLKDLGNRRILVATNQQKDHVCKVLSSLSDITPEAFEAHVVVAGSATLVGQHDKQIYVDNAEHVLQSLLGTHTLAGASWTSTPTGGSEC